MVPFLTKKKSFNRSFPNGIGSLIADDVVIISKRAIPTQVVNMLTDDEISKVIITYVVVFEKNKITTNVINFLP
jgi:hypothetical protein